MESLRQVGLLNPDNLLWALSIAILLAIYLRSRSRPTLEVSSLLLFEPAAAPAARVRHLRIDPLFWLEAAILGAIALALAGLYVRTAPAAAQGKTHALVFDLAAGMDAHDSGGTRLDLAKKDARAVIDAAPERDRFIVIGYALEAEMIHSETANRDSLRNAISGMRASAVAHRPAAQSAALMRARAAGEVELFADRRPPDSILADAGLSSRLHFHQAGSPAENLAIVSLDPGIPNISRGRAALKNFGRKPRVSELAIDSGGKTVFDQSLILAPGEQVIVPFGPLMSGGLVHARLVSPDALAADNERYTYAPLDGAAKVIVLSPDAAARDDIARVLLAVNSNFIITAADPAKFAATDEYSLAVMHDCYIPSVKARATLLVFPPASASAVADLRIAGTIPAAQLTGQWRLSANTTPTSLGAVRRINVPGWMTVKASGTAPGMHEMIPMVAMGSLLSGNVGLLSFDIREHLLLDPDRLDALVATVDLVRELTAPTQLQIVSTGTFLAIPAPSDARIVTPDGSSMPSSRDKWGRLRIRPLQAGHYSVESTSQKVDIYSNYYDASESDLSGYSVPSATVATKYTALESISGPKQLRPISMLLILLALFAMILESALLLRNARRWGLRHV